MKLSKTFLVILFISLLSPSWSESMDDLIKREGIYYLKFSDVPFTGKVTGYHQVFVKNGKFEGAYLSYYDNGQLAEKGNYKNGLREGAWVSYYKNGQLLAKGNYKNGLREGAWVDYVHNGTTYKRQTGTFKNGHRISD